MLIDLLDFTVGFEVILITDLYLLFDDLLEFIKVFTDPVLYLELYLIRLIEGNSLSYLSFIFNLFSDGGLYAVVSDP